MMPGANQPLIPSVPLCLRPLRVKRRRPEGTSPPKARKPAPPDAEGDWKFSLRAFHRPFAPSPCPAGGLPAPGPKGAPCAALAARDFSLRQHKLHVIHDGIVPSEDLAHGGDWNVRSGFEVAFVPPRAPCSPAGGGRRNAEDMDEHPHGKPYVKNRQQTPSLSDRLPQFHRATPPKSLSLYLSLISQKQF